MNSANWRSLMSDVAGSEAKYCSASAASRKSWSSPADLRNPKFALSACMRPDAVLPRAASMGQPMR